MSANHFLFQGPADELDPALAELIRREDRRQQEKVILIPSVSIAPDAVRELMATRFGNVYAEGYPRVESRLQAEEDILDFEAELAHYRRYGDPRYYKGVEYADILEALARRRAAELFAANGIQPEKLYVNVQPLSGSPANSQVFAALMEPGDTLMGLELIDGGHLTHGSKVNRSGRVYNAISYRVDPETERLDYDAIEQMALETRPRLIIAGYTAYPLVVDWSRFRAIADACGAYLLADIAHISGLVAAGVHPSPVGIADVVTTTTHKSLCGPRGAMILTHRPELARLIDRAVFPGEQGGPHLNTIAALALALRLAHTKEFRQLQRRTVDNSRRLAQQLAGHGLRIVAGTSENHLLLVDVKSVVHDGVPLSGDMAARILDVAGFVTNRNTIPGDRSALAASGVRMGTVWVSQLGYGEQEIDLLAEGIATVLHGCQPYAMLGRGHRQLLRSKVSRDALLFGREIVGRLTEREQLAPPSTVLTVRGAAATLFLNGSLASDVLSLEDGDCQSTTVLVPGVSLTASLERLSEAHYRLHFATPGGAMEAAEWLRDLSDGYVLFADIDAKLHGPVVVEFAKAATPTPQVTEHGEPVEPSKPFYVGASFHEAPVAESLPPFEWNEPADAPLKRTNLHSTHVEMGGRMVAFGGWDMPVWYTSVSEEHTAVRQAAGLFDVSHMGVLEASGPFAAAFLDTVTTNDIVSLEVGRSHYTYLLLPDGQVIDDLLIYRRAPDRYMLVVNAANNDKDWAWLQAVNAGTVQIDAERPWARVQHPATLRNLRDPLWGDECLVDIALQGPASTEILLSLSDDPELDRRIRALPWAGLTEGRLGGFEVVISRTGYTGERRAYELFVNPENSIAFWNRLHEAGKPLGVRACGLAARDSTRTEAGLPLYGHELAGPLGLNPAQAGFGSYVKTWKPFFVGRQSYRDQLGRQEEIVVRFRMNEKGVRRAELGDPVLDRRGRVVGTVTSCAIDSEGYLLGQAVVPLALSDPGTGLLVYQLGGGQRQLTAPKAVSLGARMPVPDGITVLSRFP
jgi:glycine hydroxymethyltransferase